MKYSIELPENKIKQVLKRHLVTQGWNPGIVRKTHRGFVIIATRGDERWIISIKGEESPNFVESFVIALGSSLFTMEDAKTKHSVALPDTMPFRNLWHRLPFLAKKRAGITAIFVNKDNKLIETEQ